MSRGPLPPTHPTRSKQKHWSNALSSLKSTLVRTGCRSRFVGKSFLIVNSVNMHSQVVTVPLFAWCLFARRPASCVNGASYSYSVFPSFRLKISSRRTRVSSSCTMTTWVTCWPAPATWAPDWGLECTSSCPRSARTRGSMISSRSWDCRSAALAEWTRLPSEASSTSATVTV